MSRPLNLNTPPDPDARENGISRSNALGRVLHFESLMKRRLGEPRLQRYIRLFNYYANQNLPPDNVDQPLMINYFKPVVDKHTSYLWGQWEKQKRLFSWRVTPHMKDEMDPQELQEWTEYGQKIQHFLESVYEANRGNKTIWQASKNGSLYGDSILEIHYDERQRRIIWEPILPEYFHCMWEISNMQNLLEVIIAYPIDRMVAFEQYGTSGNDKFIGYQAISPDYAPGIGILWKRWSSTSFQVWVDDINVTNAPNPYMPMDAQGRLYPGIIPFLHVPNMQAGSEFWGYSDGEFILQLSDELNRRMADMGDIVNTHGHPIFTITGYSGNSDDLPVGPDSVWDLGKDGKADRLDGAGPGPDVIGYLKEVKEAMQETAHMPAVAFGSSTKSGGSHSSGLAMAMAMMPVVERAREKRVYWQEALRELPKMIFYILYVRDPALLESAGIDYRRVLMYDIEPVFADVLPKDELQVVNEAVATYGNGLRSIERALEILGEDDIQNEKRRIQEDMLFKASVAAPTPPADGGSSGKNSEDGQGGTPGIPGSIGAGAGKPGSQIKSPDLDQLDNVSMAQTP